jgi:hypothetical protein
MPKFKLFKWVNVYDPSLTMFRVCRLVWTRGKWGEGGYDACLSLALRPALFSFHREYEAWLLTICGVRLHYKRSYSMGMC